MNIQVLYFRRIYRDQRPNSWRGNQSYLQQKERMVATCNFNGWRNILNNSYFDFSWPRFQSVVQLFSDYRRTLRVLACSQSTLIS